MPSMPVGWWGDADRSRYHASYFGHFAGVWQHGDWIRFSDVGSCVVMGRSDATLNRGGVRLGTSEFYQVLVGMPEVADSLVVHLEDPAGGMGELILFVALREGLTVDGGFQQRVGTALREALCTSARPRSTGGCSPHPCQPHRQEVGGTGEADPAG